MIRGRWPRFLLPLVALSAVALAPLGCGEDTGGPGEAKALLRRAFDKPVRSAEVELSLKMDLKGSDRVSQPIDLKLSGPYRLNGGGELPSLDWDVRFSGGGVTIAGGLVVTREDAYVELQGTSYALGPEAFADLSKQLTALQSSGSSRLGAVGIDPTTWLRDAKVEDGEDVAGESTRQVSGPVDVRKVVADVVELLRSPELRSELDRQGRSESLLPKPTKKDLVQIESSVKRWDAEVNVGEDDTVRRFFTELEFDFRGGGGRRGADVTSGKVALGYVLSDIDEQPVIRAPKSSRPLRELLDRFGLGGLLDTR